MVTCESLKSGLKYMQPKDSAVGVTPVFRRKPSAQIPCDMRFICPQQWGKLQRTGHANVRHCQVCARDVHYCRDEAELATAIAASHCVAFVAYAPQKKPKKIKMLGDPICLTDPPPEAKVSVLEKLWKSVRVVSARLVSIAAAKLHSR